ncbi:PEP-CTERM sorting domain-containing protein [Fortiea contorta]|uniref:PEP-CTERM sorting domain-containing protein n=1 Tax=Fortiea contorta TaxID=1892405 RepID=UPI0003468995|nr:PEP-CTERM sorting domain-containing protein [Fortiea contorta]
MLTSLKKAAAVAALGVGMLAAVATAPANAANIKAFTLNGTFENTAVKLQSPFDGPNPNGISVNLQGGSFDGFFEVDTDLLPSNTNVPLTSWMVNLRNASNNILKTLSSSAIQVDSYINNNTMLISDNSGYNTSGLDVMNLIFQFNPNFTGTGIGTGFFSDYTAFSGGTGSGALSVNSVNAQPVPEPLTMTATAVAAGMGLWMKRKHKASQSA